MVHKADISTKKIRSALDFKENFGSGTANFILSDISNLPFRDQSFNIVLCVDVLEHIVEYTRSFSKLASVLRGKLILHVPKKIQGILCRVTAPDHVRIGYTWEELLVLLEDNNLCLDYRCETFKRFASIAWRFTFHLGRFGFFLYPLTPLVAKIDLLEQGVGGGLFLVARAGGIPLGGS